MKKRIKGWTGSGDAFDRFKRNKILIYAVLLLLGSGLIAALFGIAQLAMQ
jgi:hypothetical protein